VKLDMAVDASPELLRETLAAVCDRAFSMARKHRCGTIVLEKGLGKLRSSGKSRSLNKPLNYWTRTLFVQILTRRARLATAARTPTCRSALGVPISMEQRCSVGMRSSASADVIDRD
jgi:hypothetical protein